MKSAGERPTSVQGGSRGRNDERKKEVSLALWTSRELRRSSARGSWCGWRASPRCCVIQRVE